MQMLRMARPRRQKFFPGSFGRLRSASNAAAELVRAGKLDEAEQAARDLLVLFPTCTMATIASAWSMRPVATTKRQPTATER
jgi:hypothetical protein